MVLFLQHRVPKAVIMLPNREEENNRLIPDIFSNSSGSLSVPGNIKATVFALGRAPCAAASS